MASKQGVEDVSKDRWSGWKRKFDNEKLLYVDFLSRTLEWDIFDIVVGETSLIIVLEPDEWNKKKNIETVRGILNSMLYKKVWFVSHECDFMQATMQIFNSRHVEHVSMHERKSVFHIHVHVKARERRDFIRMYMASLSDIKMFLSWISDQDVIIHFP